MFEIDTFTEAGTIGLMLGVGAIAAWTVWMFITRRIVEKDKKLETFIEQELLTLRKTLELQAVEIKNQADQIHKLKNEIQAWVFKYEVLEREKEVLMERNNTLLEQNNRLLEKLNS